MKDFMKRGGEFEVQERSIEDRTITGIITTNAIDRFREIVEPKGAILDNYRKNPVVLLNHISWGLPIGRNMWIKPSDNGLVAKTQFADTAEGHDLYKLYDKGYMRAWSIGFIPKKWEPADASAGYERKYTSWELVEYSAVTVPANPEAVSNMLGFLESARMREVVERSACEINVDQRLSEILLSMQAHTQSMADAIGRIAALELRAQVQEALLIDAPADATTTEPATAHDDHGHETVETTKTKIQTLPEIATTNAPALDAQTIGAIVAEQLGKKLREHNII